MGLLVFLVALFIAYKLIPVKVRAADLRQTVTDEAKSAGSRNDAVIMKSILEKAQANNLPVAEENVQINRTSNRIVIDVEYTVPIEFPGYTYKWNFHHHMDNPIF
jgi:hypothetical protein